MPIARPTMLASASGELKTRSPPKRALQAVRDLEDAALALDLGERSSRRASATSSPKTTMRGSRAISSCRQALSRSTIVLRLALAARLAWRRPAEVGSTSGE